MLNRSVLKLEKEKMKLFEEFNLDGLHLNNRIVMAPMTRARAGENRIPNEIMAEYYTQRASAGLIIAEATTISEQANGWLHSAGIYSDEMTDGWSKVVNSVHQNDGKIFLQLWHSGRASHSSFHNGVLPVAPSAIKLQGEYIHTPIGKQNYETPRALETDEIQGIVQDYVMAAQRAKLSGFDGIEIHAANGFLIDEFLQSKTNQRDDRYGGSEANRFRFLQEIIEAVIEVWPAANLGVHISPNNVYNDMGSPDFRETFLYVAKQLDPYSLAYLHIIDGLEVGFFHGLGEPMTLAEFREVYNGVLMGNCGYTQKSAEQAIADGHADLISFGRPYISNPDLVERFRNDWELSPLADESVWYSFDAKGYTDFPNYQPDKVIA